MAGMKILLNEYKFSPYQEFSYEDSVNHSGYKLTFCIDQYLNDVDRELKDNTTRVYKTRLKLFKEWLTETNQAHMMIFQVTKTHVFTFLKKYQFTFLKKYQDERAWTNKTYNHYIQAISTFFLHYMDNYEGYLTANPCARLKRLEPLKKGNRPYVSS